VSEPQEPQTIPEIAIESAEPNLALILTRHVVSDSSARDITSGSRARVVSTGDTYEMMSV
jgi:hypothetical protein